MQKLKSTCDMCSISKLRCDKTKPACGRCKRLEYPCNYSPTRSTSKNARPQSAEKSQKFSETKGAQPSSPLTTSSLSSSSSISSLATSRSIYERHAESVSSQLMLPEILFSDGMEHALPFARQADFVFDSYETWGNMNPVLDEMSMLQIYDDDHASTTNQLNIQQLYRQNLPGPSGDISEYYYNTGEVSATWGQAQIMSPAAFDTQFIDHIISDQDYATMATTCAQSELYQQQHQQHQQP